MSQLGRKKDIIIFSWDGGSSLVVGGDISVRRIMDPEGWKLVDNLYGKGFLSIQQEWSLVVGYGHIVHFLGRALLVFLL